MQDYMITERPISMGEEKTTNEMPISAMVDAATNLSGRALEMTRVMKSHLFGIAPTSETQSNNPMCFKDVLEGHVMMLEKVCADLDYIIREIGI